MKQALLSYSLPSVKYFIALADEYHINDVTWHLAITRNINIISTIM